MIKNILVLIIAGVMICSYAFTQTVSGDTKQGEKFIVRTDEESINKGKKLFERFCQHCHDAYSTATIVGSGLKGILKRDVLPFSKKPATAKNIFEQLNRPVGKMPSWYFLPEINGRKRKLGRRTLYRCFLYT
jgi:hypothetical protein